MKKVILVFAQCHNPTALGDYALAGSIAHDLCQQAKMNQEMIDIVLITPGNKVSQFERLYGQARDGRLNIREQSIGLCALETFDAAMNETVALIMANHCEVPPYFTLQNVLSPKTKLIFVGAANRSVISDSAKSYYLQQNLPQHEKLHQYFSVDDMLINACGFEQNSLGFTSIVPTHQLPSMTEEQQDKIPAGAYGFMYLANTHQSNDMVIQYLRLTQLDDYVLVGDFSPNNITYYNKTLQRMSLKVPNIICYSSLPNSFMRHMVQKSSGRVVISTGVMSTLEVLQSGKLPFYQDMDHNYKFVRSYLNAINQACRQDTLLSPFISKSIEELASLLFAHKPLGSTDFNRFQNLLNLPLASDKLIEINQNLVAKQNDSLGPKIFSFLHSPKRTSNTHQFNLALKTLQKSSDKTVLTGPQAIRRAAGSGVIFELKILLDYLPLSDKNQTDDARQFTALHWAILKHQTMCAELLIIAGSDVNIPDAMGNTPLLYAVQEGLKEVIEHLLTANAYILIQTTEATAWLLVFLNEAQSTCDVIEDTSVKAENNYHSLSFFNQKEVINQIQPLDETKDLCNRKTGKKSRWTNYLPHLMGRAWSSLFSQEPKTIADTKQSKFTSCTSNI